MQPPISPGTVLNNRYELIRVIGQGGFGRTYLAADQGRFNELCALKELIPTQHEEYVTDKSQELFQREASTLYQINHPQVPQFRATFEDDGRLFLVQDYVEGQTYRELLEERKVAGQTFSEAEVRQFVLQILPVLDHIHRRGIIHRDLAPDNVILRQSDSLPVLIDFGVVKELATKIQGEDGTKAATTVGKIGFAPSEQIQMGRAYPSSDLYALAVTALVLLTGKEPRDLYDDVNLTWHWRQYATVSDPFAQVLNKMLNYRPGDRYQSTSEVQQALQPGTPPPGTSPPHSQAELSRMATVAVGQRPNQGTPHPPRNRPEPVIENPAEDSAWSSPWTLWGLVVFLIAIASLTSYGIFTALNNTPEPDPTPIQPSPTPTPIDPEIITQPIDINAGETFSERGTLNPNTILNYVLTGESQQQLQATLESEGVWMTILQPNGNLISPAARRVQSWQGELPANGDYTVQLVPISGLDENQYRYRLRLRLQAAPVPDPSPDPEPSPTPEPSPDPEPTPTPEPSPAPTTPPAPEFSSRQLNLSPGQELENITGQTSPQRIQRYTVNLEEGQRFKMSVAAGNVGLTPRFPNGEPIPDIIGVSSFEFDVAPILGGGRYSVDVVADEPTEFRLQAELELIQ